MKTFFDYDQVECVEIKEAQKSLSKKNLNWDAINKRFVYKMGQENKTEVITLADLNLCILLDEMGDELDELDYMEYKDICHCSVCRKVLLPGDEAYEDAYGRGVLCDEHSVYNESLDAYVMSIYS